MKQFINLFSLALAFGTIIYVAHYVASGDICRTIFGCTSLIMCELAFGRSN